MKKQLRSQKSGENFVAKMGASLSALSHAIAQPENEELMRAAFEKYDRDHSGRLEHGELVRLAADCRALVTRQKDEEGKKPDDVVDEKAFVGMVLEQMGKPSLSYEEFGAFVRSHRSLEDFALLRVQSDEILCEFEGHYFVAGKFNNVFDYKWQEIIWNSGCAKFDDFPAFEDMTIFMGSKVGRFVRACFVVRSHCVIQCSN
jgi:hypothetical protein